MTLDPSMAPPRPRGLAAPPKWRVAEGSPLSGSARRHGGARCRDPGRLSGGAGLASGASAPLHRGHLRHAGRTRRPALPRVPGGPWRAMDLSRARAAHRLRDAGPQPSWARWRPYVHGLEEWLIRALDRFNVRGERRRGGWASGWPTGRAAESKIAAIGVRVTRWVRWHGVALNVEPDSSHFGGIVPCGISSTA